MVNMRTDAGDDTRRVNLEYEDHAESSRPSESHSSCGHLPRDDAVTGSHTSWRGVSTGAGCTSTSFSESCGRSSDLSPPRHILWGDSSQYSSLSINIVHSIPTMWTLWTIPRPAPLTQRS